MEQLIGKLNKLPSVVNSDGIWYKLNITRSYDNRYWVLTYTDLATGNEVLHVENKNIQAVIDNTIHQLKELKVLIHNTLI